MSRQLRRTAYTVAALAALVVCGAGISGVAVAAPTLPSPASTAPSSADATPDRPSVSDAPVPVLFRPVDASDGLFGMRRGSIHSASTPDISKIPVARALPSIGITPLPTQGPADSAAADSSAADSSAADSSAADSSAADASDDGSPGEQ